MEVKTKDITGIDGSNWVVLILFLLITFFTYGYLFGKIFLFLSILQIIYMFRKRKAKLIQEQKNENKS